MSPRAPKGTAVVEKQAEALTTLAIEYVSPDSIQPNDYNPNRQNEHEFLLLCKSIREDGFTQPVIVGSDGKIVDGEHRWRAAQEVGLTSIPIVRVPMEGAQARIATLRHNRARGSEDLELSVEVLRDLERLGALDWAADSLDLSDKELERLLADIPAPEALAAEEFTDAWVPGVTGQEGSTLPGNADATPNAREAIKAREKRMADAKTAEERSAAARDKSVYSVYLQFADDEADIVRRALGDQPASRLLDLARDWCAANPE
jgi:ParB/RepB/Spo0J family partition protein